MSSNISWVIGNGQWVRFWKDAWCGCPLIDRIESLVFISNDIDVDMLSSDLFINGAWNIPSVWFNLFPFLLLLISQHSPSDLKDIMVWPSSMDSNLMMKKAYRFKASPSNKLIWVGNLWNADIPPSKALLVWRLMNDKIPSDDALQIRGCYSCSICSICKKTCESPSHLFFGCAYAVRIWCCLLKLLHFPLRNLSKDNIWALCNCSSSPQCAIIITDVIVCIFSYIW